MLPIPPSVLFSMRENPHPECYFGGNPAPWPFVATGGPPPGPTKRQRFLKNSREQTIKRLQDLRAKRSDQEDTSPHKQNNSPPPLSEAELIAIFETDDLKTIRNRKKKKRRKNRKRKQQEEKRNLQKLKEEREREVNLEPEQPPALVPSQELPKEVEPSEPGEDDTTTPSSEKGDETPTEDPPIDSPPEPENLPEITLDEPSDDPEDRNLPVKESTPELEPEPEIEPQSSSLDKLEGSDILPLEPREETTPTTSQSSTFKEDENSDDWQTVKVRKKCKKNKSDKRREYHHPGHSDTNYYHHSTRPYQSKRRMHILERKRPVTRRKKCLVKPRFHLPPIQPYNPPESDAKLPQKALTHNRVVSADESSSSESLSNCSSDTSEASSAGVPSKQIKRVCSCWKDFYIYSNDDKKWLAVELLGNTLAHTHNCKYSSQSKNLSVPSDNISISRPPEPAVSNVSLNDEISDNFSDVQPTEMVLLESKNSKSEKATVTTPPQPKTFRRKAWYAPPPQPNTDWFEYHNPDMDPEVIYFNKRYSGLNLDFPARPRYPYIFTPVYRY